ncbi:hypothetical protein [Corynebacterium glyciniphilum]
MTAPTIGRPAGYVLPPELVERARAEAEKAPTVSDEQLDALAILTGGSRQ